MLTTPRLILRAWQDTDRQPFAAINADPEVMYYFPAPLTIAESDALLDRLHQDITARGWGLWAVEIKATGALAGFIGLNIPSFTAPFLPAVEIGWRLGRSHWGQGYATEGARAALDYGFTVLHLPEIVAFTATVNQRSRAVMTRLGMSHNPADDFDHPRLPAGHWLERHVLYRAARPDRSPVESELIHTPNVHIHHGCI